MANGEVCACGIKAKMILPISLKIPVQYQGVRFSKDFVNKKLDPNYGNFMHNLLNDCIQNLHTFQKNILICAPPNSGKTVWTYTLYSQMYAKGFVMPELMDLMEIRSLWLDYYTQDKEKVNLISSAKILVIKLPLDLPVKFPETMSTIIERRVRNNCSTIFLYGGSIKDLEAQDKFGKLQTIIGDGSFNSLCVKSFGMRGV